MGKRMSMSKSGTELVTGLNSCGIKAVLKQGHYFVVIANVIVAMCRRFSTSMGIKHECYHGDPVTY